MKETQRPQRYWVFVVLATGAFLIGLLVWGVLNRGKAPPTTPEAKNQTTRKRIVSLSPALTDTIASLGAKEQLVAVSDFSRYDGLPRVGTALTPAFEEIAQLEPTAIVTTGTAKTRERELSRLAPTHELPWLSLPEVVQGIRALGELTQKVEAAQELAKRFEEQLGGKPPADAPRVLLLIGSANSTAGDLWYIRPDSLHGRMLTASGYRNAITTKRKGPPRVGQERLLELDPDAIVVLRDSATGSPQERAMIDRLEKLTPLSAVKNQRVRRLSRKHLLSMGPSVLTHQKDLEQLLDELLPQDEPPP